MSLNGSASADGDGGIASYVWTENGSEIATGVNPTVTLSVGVRTIVLTVTDNDGVIDTDEVIITVNSPDNVSPTANAGADQTVLDADNSGSEEVTLDGSASTDSDGNIVNYVWTENGSEIATGVSPVFDFAVGSHTITLTVTDDDGATGNDEVIVVVNSPANQSPTANAGADQTVVDTDGSGSEEITLDGSASTDTDGTIVTYAWTQDGTQIATGVNPTITLPTGNQNITLTVTDDNGATDTDEVTITINTPANESPVANAGADQTVTDTDNSGSEEVTLNGSASADNDGTIVSYIWTENGTQVASGANPTVGIAVGSHTITLTVTDDDGATNSDEVVVIVNAPTPVADKIIIEAECAAIIGGAWSLVSDGSASGGQYALATGLLSISGPPSGADARLLFNVAVGQAGSYHLFARVRATSLARDSFWVRINGGSWIRWWQGIRRGSQFYWNEVVRSPFGLQSGNNTIEFAYREGDTQLDKLQLNLNGVLPTGLGGAEGCSGIPTNQGPLANAGADQTVTDTDDNGTEDIVLDGSASTDSDGNIVSYVWSENGSEIATGVNPTVNFAVGSHTVTLTVTDNQGATGNENVLVVVNAPVPTIPIANAGPDQATVDTDDNGNEEITLNGSASTDADGTIVGYVWTRNGTQIATGVNPTVTLPAGVTNVVLTVTDNDGNTDTDEVVITIEEAGSVSGYALYVNFSNDDFNPQKFVSPWNYTGRATRSNPRVNDLKDADGESTGVSLKLFNSTASGDRWNGSSSDGINGSLYPAEVISSYYYIDYWSPVKMTLEGLDPALTYDFTFFGGVSTGNRATEYQIGGQSVTLNATNNTSETVSITGVTPLTNGTISVSVSRGTSFRGVLNAMIVEAYVDNKVVAVSGSPSNARTAGVKGLSLELLPNPTSYNNVQLMLSNYDPGTAFRVDLVSTAGITVHSQEYSIQGAAGEKIKLNLASMTNGVYFVRVFQGSSVVQKRLILE